MCYHNCGGGDIIQNRIKSLRLTVGLNQTEFGSRLGVKQTTVAGWETGSRTISDQVVLSICREFNVDENWLRTGEGEMFRQQSREEEMAAIMGQLLADRPESFRRQLISVLLRFDPNGPEWQVLENIYEALKKEAQD